MQFTDLFSITEKAMNDFLMAFLYDVVECTIKGKEDIWWKEVVEDPYLNISDQGIPVFTLDHIDLRAMDMQCMLRFLKYDNDKKRTVNARNLVENGTLTNKQQREFSSLLGQLINLRNKMVGHTSQSARNAYDVFELEKDLSIIKFAMQPFREVEGLKKHYHNMCEYYDKYSNNTVEGSSQKQKSSSVKKYIAGGTILILLVGFFVWFKNSNYENKEDIADKVAATTTPLTTETTIMETEMPKETAPVKTTNPTQKADNKKAIKEVTSHNGQVKISLLSLEADSFELKVKNNSDIEVKLFDLPQVIFADEEAITLYPLSGENMNARREVISAGSHKVFKLSFDNADQKEIKKITGRLFSMNSAINDKNFSINLK